MERWLPQKRYRSLVAKLSSQAQFWGLRAQPRSSFEWFQRLCVPISGKLLRFLALKPRQRALVGFRKTWWVSWPKWEFWRLLWALSEKQSVFEIQNLQFQWPFLPEQQQVSLSLIRELFWLLRWFSFQYLLLLRIDFPSPFPAWDSWRRR